MYRNYWARCKMHKVLRRGTRSDGTSPTAAANGTRRPTSSSTSLQRDPLGAFDASPPASSSIPTPPRPGQPPQQQKQPPQFPRVPTIYGRTEVDLGAAIGPVPMIWSVDPPSPIRATAPPNAASPNALMMRSPPRVLMMMKPGQPARSMSIGPGFMALNNANANANANGGGSEGKGAGAMSPAPGILVTRTGSVQVVPAPSTSTTARRGDPPCQLLPQACWHSSTIEEFFRV
jgi:hypothetical protein